MARSRTETPVLDETIERTEANSGPQAHIRFGGRSFDIPLASIDIGPMSQDGRIREAIANFLEVPGVKLETFEIEREPNGNLTLRPNAVFG